MSTNTRRIFMFTLAGGGAAALAGRAYGVTPVKPSTAAPAATPAAPAATPAAGPLLPETDPQAQALGYKADTAKVERAKHPQHTTAQLCSGCNFYQGKPTDAAAPCQLFAGKRVAGKGWCSAYIKKA